MFTFNQQHKIPININKGETAMNLNYTFKTLPTRKYNQTDLATGETSRVTVTNNNNISVDRQLELLNKYDPEYLYTKISNYNYD